MLDEREKKLNNVLKIIDKQYGKGSVMKLGEKTNMEIETISTGSLLIDNALGVKGYPKGRVIEIFGPESSGKTTLALHAIAEVQKNNGIAAFIDAEHALDPAYAQTLGVDIENLIVSQPDTGEQALEITENLIRSETIDLIIIDSVAALVPEAEINGEMGATHVGLQARLMSQAMRKLSGILSKTNCTAIFINQIREKVGIMFGNPEVTPGGRALKFYSSVRIDIRKGEQIKSGTEAIGNKTKIKIVKNKVAPPFATTIVEIMYGYGISRISEIIDIAVDKDIIKKSGSWFSYKDEKIGQGKENVKKFLLSNEEKLNEIETKVLESI